MTRKIYVDGTFSLTPPCFAQIMVVLAELDGLVLPVCYALLPDKAEETYDRMIGLIRSAWPAFQQTRFSTDFEKGLINAFSRAFPNAERHGCLFHLVKNMKKKLAELNLLSRYNNDQSFALNARMISALAFIAIPNLDNAIAELAVHLPQELMPVLKYFEDTYVGPLLHVLPNGNILRREALFPPSIWSVHERTLQGEARTNNYAEAAHRRLQTEFGVQHPNIWRFIDTLRKVQHHRDMLLARFQAGNVSIPKRQKYIAADRRLLQLVNRADKLTPVQFLEGCASNFVMDSS